MSFSTASSGCHPQATRIRNWYPYFWQRTDWNKCERKTCDCVLPRTQESVVQFIRIQQRFTSFGLSFAAVRWRGNYTYEALLLPPALSIYCGSQRAACGFVYSWESEKNFSGRDQIHPDDCSKCLSDGAWMWLTLDGAKCWDDKAPKQSSASGFGVYDFWRGMCRSLIFVWVVFPSIQIHRSEYRCLFCETDWAKE